MLSNPYNPQKQNRSEICPKLTIYLQEKYFLINHTPLHDKWKQTLNKTWPRIHNIIPRNRYESNNYQDSQHKAFSKIAEYKLANN